MLHKIVDMIDDQPCFAVPLAQILASCEAGGAIQILSPAQYVTEQQLAWWKGVLVRAVADDTGNSELDQENAFKRAMPELFPPSISYTDGQRTESFPSIKSLSKKKMSLAVERAVELAHEWGCPWVTLPDPTLRSR